ncbi:hypothetical protein CMQ_2063 [Grosmannia clavigera kw1407]|uniref:Uncharacterized protein n=1 Tax=Grosmannia clavigera (strain kw1407 / UAMH 11150) TaxID=655863 RepID=F0XN49_GROCL|nr:uncharacterized protein CMQ_2063 [Grosmannia clavigera kw1407]EFX00982.1 hypothetical protein CMQ_2063 [Grosmannia clavigera kw1407]
MASQSQRSSIRSIHPLPIVLENDVDGDVETPKSPTAALSPRSKRRSDGTEKSKPPSSSRKHGQIGGPGTGKNRTYGSSNPPAGPGRIHRGTGVHPAYVRRFGLLEELYAERNPEAETKLEAQPLPESEPDTKRWYSKGGFWKRLFAGLLLLASAAVGLGVGLGIGLRKKSLLANALPTFIRRVDLDEAASGFSLIAAKSQRWTEFYAVDMSLCSDPEHIAGAPVSGTRTEDRAEDGDEDSLCHGVLWLCALAWKRVGPFGAAVTASTGDTYGGRSKRMARTKGPRTASRPALKSPDATARELELAA